MASETRDATITGALVKRTTGTVKTLFDVNAAPGARRGAMLKTLGVGSVVTVTATTAVERLLHNPDLLNVLGSSYVAPGIDSAVVVTAVSGVFLGAWTIAGGKIRQPEREGYAKVFHGVRTAGYAAGGTLALAAAAYAGLGAEHLAPEAGTVVGVITAIASGAAGAGIAGHVLQKAVQPRAPRTRPNLGE